MLIKVGMIDAIQGLQEGSTGQSRLRTLARVQQIRISHIDGNVLMMSRSTGGLKDIHAYLDFYSMKRRTDAIPLDQSMGSWKTMMAWKGSLSSFEMASYLSFETS